MNERHLRMSKRRCVASKSATNLEEEKNDENMNRELVTHFCHRGCPYSWLCLSEMELTLWQKRFEIAEIAFVQTTTNNRPDFGATLLRRARVLRNGHALRCPRVTLELST